LGKSLRRTANGELCTEESLRILRQAEAQGYLLDVEKDNTLTASKNGTSYLRSNADIERFGRSIVSFRKPMNFPKGTTVYRTKGPRVAILPDYSLIVDGGGIGGRVFESASDYRVLTGDQEDWEVIQNF
jgi:hypothetical protein